MSAADTIASLARGLDADVADVIASESERIAEIERRTGLHVLGYGIGDTREDLAAAEALLGRPFVEAETRALEACIRLRLRAAN